MGCCSGGGDPPQRPLVVLQGEQIHRHGVDDQREQGCGQAVLVPRGPGGAAGPLLGGHEAVGPEHPLRGDRCLPGHVRDAEVDELGHPLGGDQDVGRLDVAVDHPAVVGVDQPLGHRDGDLDRGPMGHRPVVLEPGPQVLALDDLHDDVRTDGLVADIEDPHQVGVVQGGHGAGLPGEPRRQIRIRAQPRGEDLDGPPAVQLGVPSPIHRRHPAVPQDRTEDEPIPHGDLDGSWLG